MDKINVAIDNSDKSFVLHIQENHSDIVFTTTKDKDAVKFINDLKILIKEYGK